MGQKVRINSVSYIRGRLLSADSIFESHIRRHQCLQRLADFENQGLSMCTVNDLASDAHAAFRNHNFNIAQAVGKKTQKKV